MQGVLFQPTMTDYSQWGEQPTILKICSEVGRFLDVGAFAAKALSNTRALYELGWSGVMIEPSPGPLSGLIREYGNDERIEIIGAAVGGIGGLCKFHVTDDAVSTTEEAHFEKWKTAGFYGTFWVPRITFPEIFNQFGAFDFVSIDTEGTSFFLLEELLKTEMRAKCICVEHDGRLLEITQLATSKGYMVAGATGDNMVLSL